MDRDIPDGERSVQQGREEGRDRLPARPGDRRETGSSISSRPSPDKLEREYHLIDSERKSLADIGRFRTVSTEDLSQQRYGSNAAKMQQDIRHLSSQGLVRTRPICLGTNKNQLNLLTLTPHANHLLTP